jgi:orotate phosphoribosyltransferase
MIMTDDETLKLFLEAGALLKGHFLLSSGRHSDQYLEKFRLVENPLLLEPLCMGLAERFREDKIEYVLGPTTAGIILAYVFARILGVPARYAETENGIRKLRRGQTLDRGAKILIVDDILTTGGAIRECIELAVQHNAEIAGIAVLADRTAGTLDLGYRLESALSMRVDSWDADECPLCKKGEPMTQPGTRNLRK